MTGDEYQKAADRTRGNGRPEADLRLAVFGLGISGEAGEVSDLIKKYIGHGHELGRVKVMDELGDVLWYIAAIASEVEVSLDDVMAFNIDKLEKRYPNGFSHEASRTRTA